MSRKRIYVRVIAIALAAFLFGGGLRSTGAQAQGAVSADQAKLMQSTERFLRVLYAWGPDVMVKVGTPGPSKSDLFYLLPIEVTLNGQAEQGEVYVSKDGKTLLQGEIFDTSTDPFAANRAKMHIDGNPSRGPADAAVTLVEFADFECPHCRELHESLKLIEMRYPQLRVVYKDFPLTAIHPWASTAAVGARCAFSQTPDAFWKVHDLIFDNQDLISTENVWDKMTSFAGEAGLDKDAFKACVSSPDAQKAVDANRADGVALGVNGTPAIYVNGRPILSGTPDAITRAIDYELGRQKPAGN